jgi:hypothetical protein
MGEKDRDKEQVGYKRPPKRTQFRAGTSGNPKGRPKHVGNFKSDLRAELNEYISVRENGRELKISKQRAFIKALVAAAIKGDMRATNALVSFCTRTFGAEEQTDAPDMVAINDLDIIEAFVERERKRHPKSKVDSDETPLSSPDREGSDHEDC